MLVRTGQTGNDPEPVPVAVAVSEGIDAGVVDWLVDRQTDDRMALTGDGGLLPALAAAVHYRITADDQPVRFVVTWDPSTITLTVDCDSACTLATVRDVCLLIASTCNDHRPVVFIKRDGRTIQSL